MCESGLHGCESALDSLNYVYGEKWFKIEARGKILRGDDKFDASEMRLVREIPIQILKHFAVECVKHVLPIWTAKYPNDNRPARAIEVVETHLHNPNPENLKLLNTAWAAARAAARAAAWDAERRWQTRRLMAYLYPKEEI